jgi:hypothetical protein
MTKRYGLDLQQRYELKQKWKATCEKERIERQKKLSKMRDERRRIEDARQIEVC